MNPLFDALVAEYPKNLWWSAPRVFGTPRHKTECQFDGYNWQICTCGHWDTETGEVFA